MKILNELSYPKEQVGRLAVLVADEDAKLFVLYDVNELEKTAVLVELDRPQDGEILTVSWIETNIYLLEPMEVIERVTEWE